MQSVQASNEWWEMWQATAKLGLSDRSIRRLIREGALEGRKAAGKWWIKATEYDPKLIALETLTSTQAGHPTSKARAPEEPFNSVEDPTELRRDAPRTIEIYATDRGDIRAGASTRRDESSDGTTHTMSPASLENRRWQDNNGTALGQNGPTDAVPSERYSLEPLESLIEVKRLGAWRKTCELNALLTSNAYREQTRAAAALLVEGYLAFAGRKVDAYLRCRGVLCRLLVDLQFDGNQSLVKPCFEAIGAVQSLIIRFSKPHKPKDEHAKSIR